MIKIRLQHRVFQQSRRLKDDRTSQRGSVPMVVMEVGKVGMFVDQDRMPEQMSVRLAAIPVEIVDVLVVRVVHVGVVRSSASCVYACA